MYTDSICEKTALKNIKIDPRNEFFSHASGPRDPLSHRKPNALYEHDSAFTALRVRKSGGVAQYMYTDNICEKTALKKSEIDPRN